MRTATATATPIIQWHGMHAFAGDAHVAVLVESWSGLKLGVWSGIDGRVHWLTITAGESATDMLVEMHARGDLETIPEDADLNP